MRRLVVNGDDFGLTPGVNAGILAAHERGILTSASLFPNASATADAIAIARRTPSLGVGCHLTLVDGSPTLPAPEVRTLAPGGRFRPTWAAFIADAVLLRIDLGEIERELTAQICRLAGAGLQLTHLDSHKHVHAHPRVFEVVVRLARRFGIDTVRVPYERPALAALWRYRHLPRARRQALENLALAPFAASARESLRRSGLPPAPHFVGRALTGAFTPAAFQMLLRTLPPGTSELMMHPGYVDPALERVRTRLRTERADEVALLTDAATMDLVARQRITLGPHGHSALTSKWQSYD
jgi:hopanoid biosynthesis associated protein HpnK